MSQHFETVGSDASARCSRDDAIWPSSAWFIVATVAAFVIFWPVGVAMLAWGLWHRQIKASSWWQSLRGVRAPVAAAAADLGSFARRRPSNESLAAYLEREQQRLREEQQKLDELQKAFEAFKEAERKASDARDFEAFLRSRGEGGSSQG